MKWKNKGKEYYKKWNDLKGKDLYIWGAGYAGKYLLKIFHNDKVTAFLDMDKEKQGEYLGIPILYAGGIFDMLDSEKSCIIISLAGTVGEEIEKDCLQHGWVPGKNVFVADNNFLLYELPKLYAYTLNKNYFFAITISITEKCTLRCKECTMSTPYVKNPSHESLENMVEDVNLLFKSVDMVANIQLIGGEPFLNPELDLMLEYLYNNYNDRYGEIIIYTNGMVPLNKRLKYVMKEYGIRVYISDYSNVSNKLRIKQEDFRKDLENEEIAYNVIKLDSWISYGFRNNNMSNKSEDEMIKFFDKCKPGCWTIHHGKLYYCYAAEMARKVLGLEEDDTNYIDLRSEKKLTCYELLEWYEGYSDQGYVSTCRICNGEHDNTSTVPVAEQLII